MGALSVYGGTCNMRRIIPNTNENCYSITSLVLSTECLVVSSSIPEVFSSLYDIYIGNMMMSMLVNYAKCTEKGQKDKTGDDDPSQTALPATCTLSPCDDRTHEAFLLDEDSKYLVE